MQCQRSERTLEERQRHLRRWCDLFGDLSCDAVEASHLETFISDMRSRYPADYVSKHVTSIKAMFNTAVKRTPSLLPCHWSKNLGTARGPCSRFPATLKANCPRFTQASKDAENSDTSVNIVE
jgi:hypothetical protein